MVSKAGDSEATIELLPYEFQHRIVRTYGQYHSVSEKFMINFHEACREVNRPFERRDKRLMGYINDGLGHRYRKRNFLLAGHLKDFTLEFAYLEGGKEDSKAELDEEIGMGVLLAPWVGAEDYIMLLYQHSEIDDDEPENSIIRLPVALVMNSYPLVNKITAAGSWQWPIEGEPPKEDEYTLQDIQNAIYYAPIGVSRVTRFVPPRGRYTKLSEAWRIHIKG